jgi:hypothetical protein
VITLQEFYDMLAAHDWSYQYSDDHKQWTKGREMQRRLVNIMRGGGKYEQLYNDYRTWFFSSDGDIVKPVRPE